MISRVVEMSEGMTELLCSTGISQGHIFIPMIFEGWHHRAIGTPPFMGRALGMKKMADSVANTAVSTFGWDLRRI